MDTFDTETRSRIMARVRSKNTGLEERFVSALKATKIKGFARYADDLPGKPDVVFRKAKIAVFVDSCFWHGCPKHLRRPSSNTSYWQAKIDRNIRRDKKVRSALRRLGWKVIRVWEHDIKKPITAIKRISRAIENRNEGSRNNNGI